MSSLHDQIMNLPCDDSKANEEYNDRRSAYNFGHRDARHAAAELALEKDKEIENLRACAIKYLSYLNLPNPAACLDEDMKDLDMVPHTVDTEKPWIPHEGGVCPVPNGTLVDVKWRSGSIKTSVLGTSSMESGSHASGAFWRHDGMDADIVAYRLSN